MNKKIFFLSLLFFSALMNAQTDNPLKVNEYKLSNGMSVWINEDHTLPSVYGAVVVNAGAKDSPNTGIAHYFEHVMFKGTKKIGTTNFAAEKIYLDSIKAKYDELAGTTGDSERKEIQKEINRLTIKSADYAIPNEFDRLITQFGGSNLNAFTSYDITAYHNVFSPQYIAQWAEINSERLIDPVFRLFQSELETVYEEKNMYSDGLGGQLLEKIMERFFTPSPYAFPVVGSLENLKNPRLSDMEKFFNDYYVAGNMCLLLVGDVHTSETLPILEKTFGRIRTGIAPVTNYSAPQPFNGIEKFQAKLPIPLIKIRALLWRGVPENTHEEFLVNVANCLLNNSNGTGMLDKLVTDNKLMTAEFMTAGFADAGLIGVGMLPNFPFGSMNKAEKLVLEQINRLKTGDFSEEMLNSVKLDLKRTFEQEMEDPTQRGYKMLTLFAGGRTWEDYLADIHNIDKITKQEIIDIANKYLTNNYLQIDKKTGNYPKEKIQKPNFEPIVPKNTEAKSAYMQKLEDTNIPNVPPRYVDFQQDAKFIQIKPLVNVYCVKNPMNDVFTLKISYGKGEMESKQARITSDYLNLLGTDNQNFEQFRNELQKLGSTFQFSSGDNDFSLDISGFDENYEATMKLVGHFMKNVKGDDKKLKRVIDDVKITYKTLTKDPQTIAQMLGEKVMYGDRSRYLNRLSMKEVKKLKSDNLLNEFQNLTKTECNIHYCGSLPSEKVISEIQQNIDLDKITEKSNAPVFRPTLPVDENTIYFINDKNVAQTILGIYIQGEANRENSERNAAILFNNYFGGNMQSILFQEVREFRSLAYGVNAQYTNSLNLHRNEKGFLRAYLSTQSDKTLSAMTLVDSLLQNMPQKPERILLSKQNYINSVNNGFPSFRNISQQIVKYKQSGYTQDPNIQIVENLQEIGLNDVETFYKRNIQSKPKAFIVVGNEKRLNMNELAKFGKIVKLKEKDVLK